MLIESNNIYNVDAYEAIKYIPDKSIDLIIADPPYQIDGLHPGTGILKGRGLSNYVEQMRQANLGDGIDKSILDQWCRVMKKINIYIWCNKEQIKDYLNYFIEKKKCNFEIIVWCKPNVPPFTGGHYLKDKEYCLLFLEKGVKLRGTYETMKTYYIMNTNIKDKNAYTHPTIKPLDIIKNFIINSSKENDVILDTFLGSGTTAVAAKELNRKYIGFEIDKKYFEIASDRLNYLTQNEAKLIKKGQMTIFDCIQDGE